MKILAIDTGGYSCSVALTENDTLKYEYAADHGRTHAVTLPGMIDAVLSASGTPFGDIDGFAVSTGPGSFTGLRIGIATIKGLGLAASKPVAAVSSLEALAYQCPGVETLICPLIDARKKEVYAAFYRWCGGRLNTVDPPTVGTPENILPGIRERCFFVGSGALLYKDIIENRLEKTSSIAPPGVNRVRASTVARLGYRQLQDNRGVSAHSVVPLYVRRPDAVKPPDAEKNSAKTL